MHLNQRTTTHRAMAKAEGNLAEGLLGAIPRVGPRGIRVSETPVLRGFSLAAGQPPLLPSPPSLPFACPPVSRHSSVAFSAIAAASAIAVVDPSPPPTAVAVVTPPP